MYWTFHTFSLTIGHLRRRLTATPVHSSSHPPPTSTPIASRPVRASRSAHLTARVVIDLVCRRLYIRRHIRNSYRRINNRCVHPYGHPHDVVRLVFPVFSVATWTRAVSGCPMCTMQGLPVSPHASPQLPNGSKVTTTCPSPSAVPVRCRIAAKVSTLGCEDLSEMFLFLSTAPVIVRSRHRSFNYMCGVDLRTHSRGVPVPTNKDFTSGRVGSSVVMNNKHTFTPNFRVSSS